MVSVSPMEIWPRSGQSGQLLQAMKHRIEIRPRRVFGRYLRWRDRPPNRETRIVPSHTPFPFGRVGGAREIKRFGVVLKRQDGMRKALRHIHHETVLGAQFRAEPLAERGRTRPEIENDVMERAANAANELYFRGGRQL